MISRKITGALAWTGLVIVIAVPAADVLLSKLAPPGSAVVGPTGQAATIAPFVPKAAAIKPATKPSTPVAEAPEPTPVQAPAASTQVAEQSSDLPAAPADPVQGYLATHKTLPSYITPDGNTPATAGANPAAATQNAPPPTPTVASTGSASVASSPVEDPGVAAPATAPKPMAAAARPKLQTVRPVTEADLKNWKSGTLEDYLRQHGLLNPSQAAPTGN